MKNQNTDVYLLPCPFCGSKPKIFTAKSLCYEKDRRLIYWYVCTSKECGVGTAIGQWTEEAAREKWNTRYVDDVL